LSNNALVLFSGGQDSATCLAWALNRFDNVETVGFDYNQRHRVELEVRQEFLGLLRQGFSYFYGQIGEDHVVDAKVLGDISETSLTRDSEITMQDNGLPSTFVPGRNLLFLTLAAAIAYRRGIKHIVTGVCETDYSGYPDCRDDTIKGLQVVINLGMQSNFVLHTPLMWLDKSDTWALAKQLGGSDLVDLIRNTTHTCYKGDRSHFHTWGYGCGSCPACDVRSKGYQRFIGTIGYAAL
jgi:7-cyano-7-deazaguanine synthase